MNLWTRHADILMYIPVLVVIQEIDTVNCTQGGPCLSYAQRSCQKEGSELWEVVHDRQINGICRVFGLYQSCIVTHMSKCVYQPHEKDLHQSDIVQHFVGPPYNCPFPAQNLGEGNSQAQVEQPSHSSSNIPSVFILSIGIVLHVPIFLL